MWRLFAHKEKHSKVMLLLYIVIFLLYSLNIILDFIYEEPGESSSIIYWWLIWPIYMIEIFKFSIFNLSYYFANSAEYSITKPVISQLKTHLQLQSIKMSTFVKYNVIYTFLKLIPFVVITVIFATTEVQIMFILVYSFFFIVKAFIGPMTTYIGGMRMEAYLSNKEVPRSERKEIWKEQLQSQYPNLNMKVFTVLQYLFVIGFIGMVALVYLVVFPDIFDVFNWNRTLAIVISVCGFMLMIVYGGYLNLMEHKQDLELHKE